MNDKVSIVVPIYKVEKYLNHCIESIVNQTYKNLEIILVDDGSPDSCPNICDIWHDKDNRIKTIHKENGGLSDARNCGIKNATGKYICFVDSDDYIDKKYVELLYKSIIKNGSRIAQCGIEYVDENGCKLEQKGYNDELCLSNYQMILDSFNNHVVENTVAWNRLYDISLFDNIKFPVGKIHEDEFTTYKLFYSVDKVSIVNKYLYSYRQTNNSIMRSTFNIKRLNILEALSEKIIFFESNGENELSELSVVSYLNSVKNCYFCMKNSCPDKKEIINELKRDFHNTYNKYSSYKKVKKLKNRLFIVSPTLFIVFKKICNR